MSSEFHNGSYWFDSLAAPAEPEPPPPLPDRTDVAIIGAGYTGLWSAYYLKQQQPDLNIVVLEADTVGFGASGRNGGWCIGAAWGIEGLLASEEHRARGMALQRAMFDTVDEVGRVSQAENIDCHYHKGGSLSVATLPFHVPQLKAQLAHLHALGFSEDDYRWLPPEASTARIGMTPNLGASYLRHCAAIHPARLVRGLADRLRQRGVVIIERTPVTAIEPGRVHTRRGSLAADRIVRATEGYTDSIEGQGRQMLPLYSMMVATEPLPDSVIDEIGLRQRETFGDPRRLVIYGQRTLDNRIAFGGRAGYYFGSQRKRTIDPGAGHLDRVEATLKSLFPVLENYAITHRWGGLMGVPRTWRPCVSFDPRSGLGWAGGYTGEGVAASNLAGRIMADLICERTSEVTKLPWVNDVPRRWEPEPLRWLAVKGIQVFGHLADEREITTGRPSKLWGTLFDSVMG